ncbi:uncharacterized protein PGTG_14386 [Puccinia graminis f. sp. tritici CRL 75-36-700-3]|uniref:DUF7143 domain-containing protein n=1 Tax=Puccinia graminis f. sp. tritici (strain CRL 75-36-700-3 / race SCCL) TaxID=418459 RepID=E3KVT6_PUCGT|nr:uncharacterized protein PGTG_14386 [Puccinia graminis f. sp. tritici CRL 75-36-700-3]EFP88302.2 hypothetical protein PGTG_14386 [Puccinia graminis f. sp. tritici CRL 75-36-700-3]
MILTADPNIRFENLGLAALNRKSAYLVQCELPCYMTGKTPLPKDVIPPKDVTCLDTKIFLDIPDVTIDGKKYSEIDFKTQGKDLTPAGYALATFTAGGDNTAESLGTANKLYTAVNAALRDRGNRSILHQLKVVDFFIGSQIAATQGPEGKKKQIRNLNKTIKNCGHCTAEERQKFQDMLTKAEAL